MENKENMQEVHDFIKECGFYFIATSVDGQSFVRPFSSLEIINDRLYVMTGKIKDVYKQLAENPKFELVAMKKNCSMWMRVSGKLLDDSDIEVQREYLKRNPQFANRYQPGDGNMAMLYIMEGKARFCTFNGENEREITF